MAKKKAKAEKKIELKDSTDTVIITDAVVKRNLQRELQTELKAPEDYEIDGVNGRLFRNRVILTEGKWTDSAKRTAALYTKRTFQNLNIKGNKIWSKHEGGTPRDAQDTIGKMLNIHYDENEKALLADLFIATELSEKAETISKLIENKYVSDLSIEHAGVEKYNADESAWELEGLDLFGVAVVERGACADSKAMSMIEEGDNTMSEAMEKRLAALEEAVVEIKKVIEDKKEAAEEEMPEEKKEEQAPVEEKATEEKKEASKPTSEQDKKLAELQTRIRELEKQPTPVGRNLGADSVKPIEAPGRMFKINSATGTCEKVN